jgi:hypothetical protein
MASANPITTTIHRPSSLLSRDIPERLGTLGERLVSAV